MRKKILKVGKLEGEESLSSTISKEDHTKKECIKLKVALLKNQGGMSLSVAQKIMWTFDQNT